MKNPVERGEECQHRAHRPSLGGTPTSACPCGSMWWGAPEDDPAVQEPPLPAPTAASLTAAAVQASWWEQHQSRVDALEDDLDRVLEPYAIHGPGLEPFLARTEHEPNELGWDAPPVRLLCPRGHLIDDVRAAKVYDADLLDTFGKRWNLQSALKFHEGQHSDGRGLHAAAPWAEVNQPQRLELRLRARCRNTRCRYDGEKKLEDLLKLYAAAVTAGLREVQFRD